MFIRFIQTLYIHKSTDPFYHTFGWARPEYHLMSWALSFLQLQKLYNKLELYATSNAAKILFDILKLPYSEVHITHDKINLPHENLWALPKIHTYSLQDEPFLHIDGDVFLFGELPQKLLNGNLIAQNFEEATDYYLQSQKELVDHFSYFPRCVKLDFDSGIPIRAVNAGILGGNNLNFMKEYTSLAFNYINKNISHFSNINVDRFNVFFEQHLFYSLAKEKGLSIEILFPLSIKDNQYLNLGNFHETPCRRNYLHLLGQYKRDEYTCRLMASKLRKLYPDYYYRIVSLFKKKDIPLNTTIYNSGNYFSINDYKTFSSNANESYGACRHVSEDQSTSAIIIENEQIKELVLLKKIFHETKKCFGMEFEDDFKKFNEKLLKVVRNFPFNEEHLYGRDLASISWYCEIFGNESDFENIIICKCFEPKVITSKFNWAGLWNKYTRIGVKYYEVLEITPDEYYNMIIPEVYGEGFDLQDIDEMEKLILDHLTTPQSIGNLFKSMLDYVDDEIIMEHLDEYKKLIIVMIKQLVLKKAIKPFRLFKPSN